MLRSIVLQLPLIGFICGGLSVFVVVMRYNLRTASLVSHIQATAASEGSEWIFWGDRDKRFAFVFRPANLLDPSDSPAVRAAKTRLLQHRHTLWRWLVAGGACMVAGPAFGILTMILVANR